MLDSTADLTASREVGRSHMLRATLRKLRHELLGGRRSASTCYHRRMYVDHLVDALISGVDAYDWGESLVQRIVRVRRKIRSNGWTTANRQDLEICLEKLCRFEHLLYASDGSDGRN